MYDIIVIGAGPAGYEVATLLAQGGKNVCIIEKDENRVGGTCLNEGCVPAKNFLESATYIKKSTYFKTCGVDMSLNSFDIEQLKNNTNKLICELRSGILGKLKKSKVTIKYGTASFIDKNSVEIDNEVIKADKIIIASGSSHKNHPLIDLSEDKIISSKEVFSLSSIPKSILIIGGGAIGCEFATFFNAFDCKVELAEFTPKLVPIEDDDVSRTLKRELEKSGIKVYLNANVTSYEVLDDGVNVDIDLGKKKEVKKYDKVLISIGRVPNSLSLNLNNANIENSNGFITVNSNLQSISNKNIYAIGDVIQSPALAHVAYYEAKRVAQIILEEDVMSEKTIFPSVTFCSPQVASIGQSEKELKNNNIEFKTKKIFFKSNGKAKIKGDDSGFIKVIYDIDSELILGASIIGNEATELIHQFLILINTKSTLKDISKMIFAHPTLSEATLDLTHM
ncbi:MAG: dihydrolipoyl dehydrogenase [Campylobacterota bacterium]|nr:dihydrolipoyl dehydrogenase [Campylobacterota bacterium]